MLKLPFFIFYFNFFIFCALPLRSQFIVKAANEQSDEGSPDGSREGASVPEDWGAPLSWPVSVHQLGNAPNFVVYGVLFRSHYVGMID